jgi:hypothetical protein
VINGETVTERIGSTSDITPKYRAENNAIDTKSLLFYLNTNPDLDHTGNDTHMIGMGLMAQLAVYTTHYTADMSWVYRAHLVNGRTADDLMHGNPGIEVDQQVMPANFKVIGDGTLPESWIMPLHRVADAQAVQDRWTQCFVMSNKFYKLHNTLFATETLRWWNDANDTYITEQAMFIPVPLFIMRNPLYLAYWTFANLGYPFEKERFNYTVRSNVEFNGPQIEEDHDGLESMWQYLYWDRAPGNSFKTMVYVIIDEEQTHVTSGYARSGANFYEWGGANDIATYWNPNTNFIENIVPAGAFDLNPVIQDAMGHQIWDIPAKVSALTALISYWDRYCSAPGTANECRNMLAMYGPRYSMQAAKYFQHADFTGFTGIVMDPTETDSDVSKPWFVRGEDGFVPAEVYIRAADYCFWLTSANGTIGDNYYLAEQTRVENEVDWTTVQAPDCVTTIPEYGFRTAYAMMTGLLATGSSAVVRGLVAENWGDSLKALSCAYASVFDEVYQQVYGCPFYFIDSLVPNLPYDVDSSLIMGLTTYAISEREPVNQWALFTAQWDNTNHMLNRDYYYNYMGRPLQRIPYSWYNNDFSGEQLVNLTSLKWQYKPWTNLYELFFRVFEEETGGNYSLLRAVGNTSSVKAYMYANGDNQTDTHCWWSSYMMLGFSEWANYGYIKGDEATDTLSYHGPTGGYDIHYTPFPMHSLPLHTDTFGGYMDLGLVDEGRLDLEQGRLHDALGVVTKNFSGAYGNFRSLKDRAPKVGGFRIKPQRTTS